MSKAGEKDAKLNDWMAKVNEMKALRANSRARPEVSVQSATVRPRSRTFAVEGTTPHRFGGVTGNATFAKSPTPATGTTSQLGSRRPTAIGGQAPTQATPFTRGRSPTTATSPSANKFGGSSVSSTSHNPASNEVEQLKKKIAQVEKENETMKKELDVVKKRREEAKKRLQQKNAQMSQVKENALQRKQTRIGATSPAGANAPERNTKRMTKAHVVDHIGKLIQEMGNLEHAIAKAEDGRIRAENDLIEYANEKKKVEENIQTLTLELEKVSGKVSQLLSLAGSNAQMKPVVLGLKESLDTCKKLAESSVNNAGSDDNTKNRRAAITFGGPPAPSSPAPKPSAAKTSNGGGEGESLLSQIRAGKTLKAVDLNTVRKERAKSNRSSMAVLLSLTDTLKKAMDSRNTSLTGGGDDDWNDNDDDELWDW